ncbi:hypothetical protein [Brevibacillus parabrevis]|uniref:hypothetical protein n=1 Tax=Brevibacillus parabrevis TaxID=54914 RepID=UPI0023805376|nr:hypothetical protein [Brevibacillus parabrevis]WDV96282.1 hypothetical protein PSE45_04790 [Brevibacillus parabrevis]
MSSKMILLILSTVFVYRIIFKNDDLWTPSTWLLIGVITVNLIIIVRKKWKERGAGE